MKYPIFKVKFLQEEIIVERGEMAYLIRLEAFLYQTKNVYFLFLTTLSDSLDLTAALSLIQRAKCIVWLQMEHCNKIKS